MPIGLSSLKTKVDILDVDKLVPIPVDLSKLSDAVKNNVVKKDVYNAKIKDIEDKIPDITYLVTNMTLIAKINEAKNKIPSITNLVTNASLNTKINELKNEIPNITNLFTSTAVNAVEHKILSYSKYICTPEFNKLTAENFTAE